MIADLHALTMEHDPAQVRAATLEVAAVLLAAGVDPQRTAAHRATRRFPSTPSCTTCWSA